MNKYIIIKIFIISLLLFNFSCQNAYKSDRNLLITAYEAGTFLEWKVILYKDFSFVSNREFIDTISIKGKWEKTATNDIRLNCFEEKNSTYCECGRIEVNSNEYPFHFEMIDNCDTSYLLDVKFHKMNFYVIDTTYFKKVFPDMNVDF